MLIVKDMENQKNILNCMYMLFGGHKDKRAYKNMHRTSNFSVVGFMKLAHSK